MYRPTYSPSYYRSYSFGHDQPPSILRRPSFDASSSHFNTRSSRRVSFADEVDRSKLRRRERSLPPRRTSSFNMDTHRPRRRSYEEADWEYLRAERRREERRLQKKRMEEERRKLERQEAARRKAAKKAASAEKKRRKVRRENDMVNAALFARHASGYHSSLPMQPFVGMEMANVMEARRKQRAHRGHHHHSSRRRH